MIWIPPFERWLTPPQVLSLDRRISFKDVFSNLSVLISSTKWWPNMWPTNQIRMNEYFQVWPQSKEDSQTASQERRAQPNDVFISNPKKIFPGYLGRALCKLCFCQIALVPACGAITNLQFTRIKNQELKIRKNEHAELQPLSNSPELKTKN